MNRFFGMLALIFIVLKLVGAIDWSWFWVLSPLVVPIGTFLFFVGGLVMLGIFTYMEEKDGSND